MSLKRRKALGAEIPNVAGTIARKRVERDLERCVESADTNAITREGGRLHRAAVTDALEARLQDELAEVGVTHLSLRMADRGAAGRRLHRLMMDGAASPQTNLSLVLSEGEHRAVAIAAMLAEGGLRGESFPMVFDDPVCSLDHRYRERAAVRLVKRSRERQVIVLTHDVFFLAELEAQAQAQGVPIHSALIRRGADTVGLCDEGKPWRTMNVGERLQWCDAPSHRTASRLRKRRHRYLRRAGRNRRRQAAGIPLEEVVEEVVFNKVVTRFQNNVAVLRLDRVVFSGEDYKRVLASYGRLSTWTLAHAESAQGRCESLPAPTNSEPKSARLGNL